MFLSKFTLISRRHQQSHCCDCIGESIYVRSNTEKLYFQKKKDELNSTAAIYNHFSIISIALFVNILIRRISFKYHIRCHLVSHSYTRQQSMWIMHNFFSPKNDFVGLRIFSGFFFILSLSYVTKCVVKPTNHHTNIQYCFHKQSFRIFFFFW